MDIKCRGKTCQNVRVIFDKHVNTSGTSLTEVLKHLQDSPTCKISFDDCKEFYVIKVILTEENWKSPIIQQLDDGKTIINNNLTSLPF